MIETLTGFRRATDERPVRKRALRLDLLAGVRSAIGRDTLPDLRDRAILRLSFAGALRRSELVALEAHRVEILKTFRRRGLRLRRSKGDRAGAGATVVIPADAILLCPLAAFQAWLSAAGIGDGPVFRRVPVQPLSEIGSQGMGARGHARDESARILIALQSGRISSCRAGWWVCAL